ncbi:Probable ubiquitin carboxyl-terminal hydrolase FAF [Eumeta japonica]|uniref:Probable ubiquitin carboxyl-terminal hydrolase FAF n=1 Tax=Eumeta variegata TaxID=151549 RepID=A0A4C1UZ04_EUMVA|nr:Probable ubiquitin carboxyl-terminal hydrolase FAF [Eumeta japonica]
MTVSMKEDEGPGEIIFSESKLKALEEKISHPRWVVPVLPEQELEALLNAATELAAKGFEEINPGASVGNGGARRPHGGGGNTSAYISRSTSGVKRQFECSGRREKPKEGGKQPTAESEACSVQRRRRFIRTISRGRVFILHN